MRKKLIVTGIILTVVCVAGILCWKTVKFNNGESFSALSGLELPDEGTPGLQFPAGSVEQEQAGEVSSVVVPTKALEPETVKEVLETENAELKTLFGDKEKSILYGEELPLRMQVIEDTVGIEMKGDEVISTEFFAKDEDGQWLRLTYEPDTEKIRVENCEQERSDFVEEQTRTELCLTWVGLENTEAYDSELFVSAQECLVGNLQKALVDGTYFEVYKSLDHDAAKGLLGEEATYAQLVWYVDNLREIVRERVSEQLVTSYLGCDVRDGYCYAGVQFGNYDTETGDYREIIEVWCTLFLSEEQEVCGFWMFGPGILNQLQDDV